MSAKRERSKVARVRFLEREDLAQEQRHVYDEIESSRGRVEPNFKALLNSPEAASRMSAMGAYVRFETSLSARVKSLAALTTAREADGDYVWTANERQASNVGLEEEIINAIRERRAQETLSPEDAAIVRFTQELLQGHRISESSFIAVQEALGDVGVVDLLVLIDYYHALSHALSALEVVDLADGVVSTLRK